MDVYNNYTSDGSNVDIWNFGTSNSNLPDCAIWHIYYNNDGTLNLASKCSGNSKFLDCYDAGTSAGTNVIQYGWNGNTNQKWVLETSNLTISYYGKGLVDSGNHLDWGGSTKYSSLFSDAVTTWNNYKSGVIRKHTASTIQDVTISDSYDNTTDLAATYPSQKKVVFYVNNMDSLVNDLCRRKTCTHELGHCLGLYENNVLSGDVMQQGEFAHISLSRNDKDSYDYVYNNLY